MELFCLSRAKTQNDNVFPTMPTKHTKLTTNTFMMKVYKSKGLGVAIGVVDVMFRGGTVLFDVAFHVVLFHDASPKNFSVDPTVAADDSIWWPGVVKLSMAELTGFPEIVILVYGKLRSDAK